MGRFERTLVTVGTAALCAMTLAVGSVEGQMPDTFTNLQYFPEDISRGELISKMRQFSFALGVRCQYCHTGGDGISFEGVDFASDEKPAKRTARAMLEMAQTINATMLTALPERGEPQVGVECRTCHRGLPRPAMIDQLMRQRIAEEGVEAAVAYYRQLREDNYGGWSYDFGEWTVNDLASSYSSEPAIAAALLRMNSDFYPDSPAVWMALGQAEAASGDTEAAIGALRRALELAPDNQRILQLLAELGAGN